MTAHREASQRNEEASRLRCGVARLHEWLQCRAGDLNDIQGILTGGFVLGTRGYGCTVVHAHLLYTTSDARRCIAAEVRILQGSYFCFLWY